MATIQNPAIPKGSTVLVTGVNGFIGSHVADQFLQLGYKVRGAVRDVQKNAWMKELFTKNYGEGQFELVAVPDITSEGAFEAAAKDASAVVHVASVVNFDPDPTKVIPVAVEGAVNSLKAANKEPSVKRYVLTSSSAAASLPNPDKEKLITRDTWNDESVQATKVDAPYPPELAMHTYAASKTLAEQAIWKFYNENQERRPDLVVNTVLPNMNFGKSLDYTNQGAPSTSKIIEALWYGVDLDRAAQFGPQYFVDVQDVARLHVAAVIHPGVKGERIFGYAERFNHDAVLDILRKQNPEREFVPNFLSGTDRSVIELRGRAEQLLQELGRPGFTSMEDSVWMNSEPLRRQK
ncbi:uncharacterized protein K452DRAFT_290798 [Aplosporella prunicola CBS 121167]|uniref:NAD-dependent epimerase/dehydratase domain-containing protein n=1 Tax=Aplosporella prunicola CBS 121167 TaxID=1176127 RepID=A0A6A6B4M4_9PEZI|nr:uncharacterized protein K452DRAFT_290798 [Aplosporella prunicola CBS 121167]KAF2138215.1 hypothetical protein K452DRAFT_290798 [Aplosporella prunicola CBS 121167]